MIKLFNFLLAGILVVGLIAYVRFFVAAMKGAAELSKTAAKLIRFGEQLPDDDTETN